MSKNKYLYINNHILYLDTICESINNHNTSITEIIDYLKTPNTKTPNTKTPYKHNIYNIQSNNNYYILNNNGKLISKNTNIENLYNQSIYLIERQNGGSIIDAFMSIVKLGEFFVLIAKGIIWFIKFIAWFLQFVFWFFVDFLNPVTFCQDFFNSLMIIVIGVCKFPFDILRALFATAVNTLGGWMQGFWGWDMSGLTKNDKDSVYFKSFDRLNGQKSYLTNTNTVPFSIILGTILCPPMGVFMDMGVSGWFNILICALLTLLFYLPGLCYALLIIYA